MGSSRSIKRLPSNNLWLSSKEHLWCLCEDCYICIRNFCNDVLVHCYFCHFYKNLGMPVSHFKRALLSWVTAGLLKDYHRTICDFHQKSIFGVFVKTVIYVYAAWSSGLLKSRIESCLRIRPRESEQVPVLFVHEHMLKRIFQIQLWPCKLGRVPAA